MLPAGQLDKRPKKHHIMTESWSRLSGKCLTVSFFLSLAPAGWSRGWEGKTQLTAASLTRLARLASTPLATCDWVCACACVFSFWNAEHTHSRWSISSPKLIDAGLIWCPARVWTLQSLFVEVYPSDFTGFFLRVLPERGSRSAPLRSGQSSGSPNLQWVSESLNTAPC